MKEKINIVELLKDCPSGMELDSTIMENVYFDEVLINSIKCYSIKSDSNTRNTIYFTKFGEYFNVDNAKCVIFPKGKTTWEGFQRPFKEGDVVSAIINGNLWYGIYQKESNEILYCYVSYSTLTKKMYHPSHYNVCSINSISEIHFATEEEKEKLFNAIEDNGYKWNPETKTLEKLVEPRFKVGDQIVKKNSISNSFIVNSVSCEYYGLQLPDKSGVGILKVNEQDEWELVPDKFDISTLKPFESKVLVRGDNGFI